MKDRERAIRNYYDAIFKAINESPTVQSAMREMEICGITLNAVDVQASITVGCPQTKELVGSETEKADAAFLRFLRIDPNLRESGR